MSTTGGGISISTGVGSGTAAGQTSKGFTGTSTV